jgi:hypothetical protein
MVRIERGYEHPQAIMINPSGLRKTGLACVNRVVTVCGQPGCQLGR